MINPQNIPVALTPLIPMVEKWGINDDGEREELLALSTSEELNAIIHCIDDISDEDFYGWLSGPEARNPHPTEEYIAFSCLALAIDYARVRLKKLQKSKG